MSSRSSLLGSGLISASTAQEPKAVRADGRYERRDEPFPRPRHLLRAVRRLLRLGLEDRRSGKEPRRDRPCSHGLVGPDPHSLRGRPRPDGEDRGGLPRRRRPDPGRARVSRLRPHQAAGHRSREPDGARDGDAARREARADVAALRCGCRFLRRGEGRGSRQPRLGSAPRPSRACSAFVPTIQSSKTISSSCPATRSRGRRPPTRSRGSSTSPAGSTTTPKPRPRRSRFRSSLPGRSACSTRPSADRLPYVWGGTRRSAGVSIRRERARRLQTAPASSGACTSFRPTPAARLSRRRSKAARPTR